MLHSVRSILVETAAANVLNKPRISFYSACSERNSERKLITMIYFAVLKSSVPLFSVVIIQNLGVSFLSLLMATW